jgi:hypothetical protein
LHSSKMGLDLDGNWKKAWEYNWDTFIFFI